MEKGCVYFFTGLSGAGKTTLGSLFYKKLREKKPNVFLMDGDVMRNTYYPKMGYSLKDRHDSCIPTFELCRVMADQGIDVVICSIAMFDDIRQWNREHLENYKEIYIKVKMETLYQRDQKGIYSKGHDVVGIDLPCEYPKNPDIIVHNDGDKRPEVLVDEIYDALINNSKEK